jgi:CBS domain-containing protein
MSEPRVRDWMNLGVITCDPETAAEDVAETMRRYDVSALVVTDAHGYAVGLVSRTDLVAAASLPPYPGQRRGLTARHLMSAPVITVRADAPLAEAVRMILERHIHRIVVTVPENGRERPIGILSVTDLVGHLREV